jgi:hypothetical protein
MEIIFEFKISSHDLGIDDSQYSEKQLKKLLIKELIESITNYDFEKSLVRNPYDYITFRTESPSLEAPKSKIPIY